MKVNWTLLTTLVLAIVVGGLILAWFLRAWKQLEAKLTHLSPQLPLGPVGFKMLPACALPGRA